MLRIGWSADCRKLLAFGRQPVWVIRDRALLDKFYGRKLILWKINRQRCVGCRKLREMKKRMGSPFSMSIVCHWVCPQLMVRHASLCCNVNDSDGQWVDNLGRSVILFSSTYWCKFTHSSVLLYSDIRIIKSFADNENKTFIYINIDWVRINSNALNGNTERLNDSSLIIYLLKLYFKIL